MSRVRIPSIALLFSCQEIPLNFIQALLLGIVQGICEFFPISSSAHLKLARHFLGLSNGEDWLYFDLACHFGTWLALAYFLRREVLDILRTPQKIALFALALLPLIPAYFFLKPFLTVLSSPHWMGYFILVTAMLLFLAIRIKRPESTYKKRRDVIFIGLSQAFALLPGLSRSGATMTTARFCGWTWIESAKFSFLLAIPTILGGEILESLKQTSSTIPLTYCAAGFLTSFIMGTGAVRLAFWMYEKNIVRPFAWYCLGAGFFMIAIFR